MATLKELEQALLGADAAGDVEAARLLAQEIQRMRTPAALAASSQVTPTQQADRDKDAIPILMQELQTAQTKAQAGDPRAQSDLESISRELARKGVNVSALPAPTAAAPAPIAAPAPAPIAASAPSQTLKTTVPGLAGAATRGLALPAAGALAGAALGAPFAGVGAIPGAIAGAGAATLAGMVGDPIVSLVNNVLNTKYTLPTDAMEDLLTRLGMAKARSEAEKIVQATAAGAGMAGGTVAAGRAIQAAAGQAAPVAREVGRMLATQPILQVVSGAAGGAAGQTAQELGADIGGQIAASVAGGLTPLSVARRPRSARSAPAPRVEPTFEAPPAIVPEAPPAVAPAVAGAVETVAESAPMTFTGQLERADASEVLSLARKASGMGPGSSAAKARLVDMAQVNPEAAAAAQRLGIELPFDVLSDNPQVRSAVGLTRALVAGEAEAAWEATTRQAIQRADEISKQFDAAFIEGRPATGLTSQKILDNLTGTRDTLKTNSKVIYDRIDGVEDGADGLVPKSTPITLNNIQQTLSKIISEVGDSGLSAKEKELLKLATEPGVTYGRLLREKRLIGKAQAGLESPYGSMAEADLGRLYGALARDQLDNVGNFAGDEVRRELRAANLMTAKRKALEKRIIGAFGKEIDGSVAQKMQSAISSASTGDAAAFNRLMKVVPKELQKETVATALASVTAGKGAGRAAGSSESVFSPTEFTKVYRGLRANPPVYAQMVKIMGPEWDRASRDLFELSRRIADAQGRIPTTGKANQILGNMAIDGMLSKVISSSIAQRTVTGVTGLVPGLGAIAPDIIGYMAGAKGAGVQKASKLFASPEFQELAIEAATKGTPSAASLRKTAMSKSFGAFADAVSLPKQVDARVQFLQSAIQAGQASQENE